MHSTTSMGQSEDTYILQQRAKSVLELAYGRGGDAFESRLEDTVQFALEQIRQVGRDLGRNAPYQKNKPPYICLCRAQSQCDKACAHELHR